jgi:RNA 2',3'-cyclic 3'-phosphodiesterase
MRMFVAIDIDDAIRRRISAFMDGLREFASDARWVRPESMHITLKFIGEKPNEAVEPIKNALKEIRSASIPIAFRGYGFFPNPRTARVLWIGIQAGPELTHLAAQVENATNGLGIPENDHPFSPHLTLARGGGRSRSRKSKNGDHPNSRFTRLHENLATMPMPEFGVMTAREFYLFESKLGPGGSKYTKLEKFSLLGQ